MKVQVPVWTLIELGSPARQGHVSELRDSPDPRTRACLASPVQLGANFCVGVPAV